MAKINKLALARFALRMTINQLDDRELLCVLNDLYTGGASSDSTRWYGNGGGTSGLEQGIYNHMTTFRRVSDLWTKLTNLHGGMIDGNKDKIKQETIRVRDIVVKRLDEKGVKMAELELGEPNE